MHDAARMRHVAVDRAVQAPGGRVRRIGPVSVSGSLASISSMSLALTREKCTWFGFIRNRVPSSFTASEKWLATASCMLSLAVQRKAQARSTRSS